MVTSATVLLAKGLKECFSYGIKRIHRARLVQQVFFQHVQCHWTQYLRKHDYLLSVYCRSQGAQRVRKDYCSRSWLGLFSNTETMQYRTAFYKYDLYNVLHWPTNATRNVLFGFMQF